MPIKLPKGFKPRRKSSGQALEEVENPPQQSTFRVIERSQTPGRTFDPFNRRKPTTDVPRPVTYGPNDFARDDFYSSSENADSRYGLRITSTGPRFIDDSRKSGATVDSFSSGPANNSAASSMRLSATSTVPSSTDLSLDYQKNTSNRKPLPPDPYTSRPKSSVIDLNTAGRSFSYGSRSVTPGAMEAVPTNPSNLRRERAMTTSSASTATPPRLLDSEFNLGSGMDDFENMFDVLDKKSDTAVSSRDASPSIAPQQSTFHKADDLRRPIPSPITIDRTKEIESPPISWNSQRSNDGLMTASSPLHNPSASQRTSIARKPPPSSWNYNSSLGESTARPDSYVARTSSPLKDNSAWSTEDTSRVWRGAPGAEARQSPIHPGDGNSQPATSERSQGGMDTSNKSGDTNSVDIHEVDPTLVESVHLASEYERVKLDRNAIKPPQKVMTPAQFERYRQEQDSRLQTETSSPASAEISDREEEDDDEEEDDTERARKAMQQRRKQEAHLSVYRQQMMKVTGEKLDIPVTRPTSARASTLPNLSNRLSTMQLDPSKSPASGLSSEGEEDEDVPLGILAAHGFPNKNRPPTRASMYRATSGMSAQSDSQVNLAGLGDPSGVVRGNLPAFARKLPQDPYFGAGLVYQTNRESLAMSGGASVRGMAPPGLPPGGLVGVIAGEERARAIRRASPNAQVAAEGMGMMGGMGGMGGMPAMPSPSELSQFQMQAQMNQMMQMQMQWMHQMQNMMQGPPQMMSPMMGPTPNQIPGQMPPFAPSAGFPSPGLQPQGMHMPPGPQLPPPQDQRAMSMVNTANSWNRPMSGVSGGPMPGPMYTPSIAPSERSNVGMASRYRPVSYAPSITNANRTSTFTGSVSRPWLEPPDIKGPKSTTTVRVVADEDDDEQAWAEMKRKRDEKKSAKKSKRGQQELAALYHGEI